MRYTLYVVLTVAILLYLSFTRNAVAADSPDAMASPYYELAQARVPVGAEITQITLTTHRRDLIYINFTFQGGCFIMAHGDRRFALTSVPCG